MGVFSPVLLTKYRIFISIVDISANLKNIGIDIDIDKEILENIDIDINIDKDILENIDINIDIDKDILENIDIDIDIDKDILENIDIDIDIDKEISENIDIDKKILENIDIDKISNRLEFGISNRASSSSKLLSWSQCSFSAFISELYQAYFEYFRQTGLIKN